MQTGSIGKQDQWARFMQLSNEARTRNRGLSNGNSMVKRPSVVRQGALPTLTSVKGTTTFPPTPKINSAYTPSLPSVATRILGGTFDAYA